jgi:sugar-specific transcriptional regulator TrmB
MNKAILKKIGLNDKEINVYFCLLENGAMSVRDVAMLTKINRGTSYDILKKLSDLKIVSYYSADTKQKFIAEEANSLLKILKEKENKLKETKESLNKIIPELKALQEKNGFRPTSKLFEGKKGIKFILEDLLDVMSKEKKEKREYYIYSAKSASNDIRKAFPDFTKKRIKKEIKVKAISLAKGGGLSGLDERKWLGTNDESATFIILYKGKSAYISRDLNNKPVGVLIENKLIYETQKNIFLKLWSYLKI